ncbi:hypothetical protein [Rhizobium sp. SGZ-381]|uniref:hypothetical protein n=1 Tax=Rhizobium sp. SGZ-381 TaxID=3342800 RepID=UPI003671444A
MGTMLKKSQIIVSGLALLLAGQVAAQTLPADQAPGPTANGGNAGAPPPSPSTTAVVAASSEQLAAFLANPQSLLTTPAGELSTFVASLLLAATAEGKLTEALTALQAAGQTADTAQADAMVRGANLAAAALAATQNQLAAAQIQVAISSSNQLAEAAKRLNANSGVRTAETPAFGGEPTGVIGAGTGELTGVTGGDGGITGTTGGGATATNSTSTSSGSGTFSGSDGGTSSGSGNNNNGGGGTSVSPTANG